MFLPVGERTDPPEHQLPSAVVDMLDELDALRKELDRIGFEICDADEQERETYRETQKRYIDRIEDLTDQLELYYGLTA